MLHVQSKDVVLKQASADESVSVLVGRHQTKGAAKQQTVAIVEVEPGGSSDPHFHKEREESYYFLSGEGLAVVGEKHINISPGDLIFTKPGERHEFKNTGSSNLRYLVFTSPAWVPEDSFK